MKDHAGFQDTVRHAAFQVSTIMTTTAIATTDFDKWPEFSRALLVLLLSSARPPVRRAAA